MTPGARVAAAIAVLDEIESGMAAEQALLRWSRASRFAGSKDRAAVRDLVFDALRHWRSDAALGGGTSGRARMLGRLRAQGSDPDLMFSSEGYAAQALSANERAAGRTPEAGAEALDVPDWVWSRLESEAVVDVVQVAQAWQARAPVTVRVNAARATRAEAMDLLAQAGIEAAENARSPMALTLGAGVRKLRQSQLFLEGLVEIQDASSQAVVDALPQAATVLDFCAGGGGKALAMAAAGLKVTAHDIDPARMSDIAPRAVRAQAQISCVDLAGLAGQVFDIVLCDAPCSGSGAWRRNPEGKWRLTAEGLADYAALQGRILDQAATFVAPGGTLAYATCSVFASENEDSVAGFLKRSPGWHAGFTTRWPVDTAGDGFFTVHLTREPGL